MKARAVAKRDVDLLIDECRNTENADNDRGADPTLEKYILMCGSNSRKIYSYKRSTARCANRGKFQHQKKLAIYDNNSSKKPDDVRILFLTAPACCEHAPGMRHEPRENRRLSLANGASFAAAVSR
jgi:hypothetical protein